jgi:hypothetical protein
MHTAAPPTIRRHGAGWLVPSSSVPGARYFTTRTADGRWRCTCSGFAHRGRCRHITAVQQGLKGGVNV